LKQLVERVVGLESRLSIAVLPGLAVFIHVDPDQLEQALINLSRNAVEAVLMNPKAKISDSAVTISWAVTGDELALWIRDEGVGLLDSANLFVPFYTTKETGTGIGLLLSRQVAEAHGGRLMIRNREDVGCEVEIKIPACVVEDSISVENDYHLR
jgi:signal transduction histidine kinase